MLINSNVTHIADSLYVVADHNNHAARSISYWDALREVDRIACINPPKFRKSVRKTGWLPVGEKWAKENYPGMTKDAGNYEKHNKEVSWPCWLYMIGEMDGRLFFIDS
jgi:hypothetical protein